MTCTSLLCLPDGAAGWMPVIAAAAGVAGAAGLVWRPAAGWPRHLLWLAAAVSVAAFLWLLGRFVVADASIEYVYLYTHADLDLRWRVAGTWTGRQGSLLLWATWTAVVTAVFAWRTRRRAEAGPTVVALALLQIPLLLATAGQQTFAATPEFLLASRAGGSAFHPTLKSAFILIHPPLMFLAYALTSVLAAAGLAHLWRGDGVWSTLVRPWTRTTLWLYSFAMALGAMWAYVTLTFGGYWAWDPVEVANLLPWLAIAVFVHAEARHARRGSYPAAGPVLATLPMVLTLFSTLSTRSGLWVSVHSFTAPANTFRPDPAMRLLDILKADPSLLPFVGLTLALPAFTLALWTRRLAADPTAGRGVRGVATSVAAVLGGFAGFALAAPEAATGLLLAVSQWIAFGHVGYGLLALVFMATMVAGLPALLAPEPEAGSAWRRLGHGPLAAWAVTALGMGLMVLWLFHVAAVQGWSQAAYEARVGWLAAPAVAGVTALQARAAHGAGAAWRTAAAGLAVGALAAVAAVAGDIPAGPTFLLGQAIVLLGVSLDNVRRQATTSRDRRVRIAHGLLLGALLLDLVWWSSPPPVLGWSPPWWLAWVMVPAAIATTYGAVRLSVGAPAARPGVVHFAAGVLGGFLVAPLLAAAAWRLGGYRGGGAPSAAVRVHLRKVGLYGLHLGLALIVAGYAASTALREEAGGEVDEGGATAGRVPVTYEGMRVTADHGPFIQQLDVVLSTPTGKGTATWTWEPRLGAWVPEPAILRTWTQDVYVAVDGLTVAGCFVDGPVRPLDQPDRLCSHDAVPAVQLRTVALPGMGLLWSGLAVLLGGLALLMATGAERARAAGESAGHELPGPRGG